MSPAPFGNMEEWGFNGDRVSKLALPGGGAAGTFVYTNGKLSQILVAGVLSEKSNGIQDPSFTFCFRNLDI